MNSGLQKKRLNIDFLVGDSERITEIIPRQSVDMVIDIKSSFFYPDKEAFMREVHEVLNENGIFLYSVPLFRTKIDEVYQYMKKYFYILREDDITENCLRALHLDSDRTDRFIDSQFPIGLRSLMK